MAMACVPRHRFRESPLQRGLRVSETLDRPVRVARQRRGRATLAREPQPIADRKSMDRRGSRDASRAVHQTDELRPCEISATISEEVTLARGAVDGSQQQSLY